MSISPLTHPPVRPLAAIVGAGPAGLMAADVLSANGVRVVVFDRMASPARKFLMAGRGGLNLTHSEPAGAFIARYGDAAAHIAPMLEAFDAAALRHWADGLGAETFVGSSGRVFPRAMKASPLLRAWLLRLAARGVELRVRHRWTGWRADGALEFETPEGAAIEAADVVVLAMGGASWPRLGSDGAWAPVLDALHIPRAPFRPANAGILVPWSAHFRERFSGAPLKNCLFRAGDESVRGDAVVTPYGLEGGPIYGLCPVIRRQIDAMGAALIGIDLRPDATEESLRDRLETARAGLSLSERLRKSVRLAPVAQGILREAGGAMLCRTSNDLAHLIKHVSLPVQAIAPMERAISSAGGVQFNAVDPSMMLHARPGVFVAGEMLDWEAPTGGYLLQAVFASGVTAARGALAFLQRTPIAPPQPGPILADATRTTKVGD